MKTSTLRPVTNAATVTNVGVDSPFIVYIFFSFYCNENLQPLYPVVIMFKCISIHATIITFIDARRHCPAAAVDQFGAT